MKRASSKISKEAFVTVSRTSKRQREPVNYAEPGDRDFVTAIEAASKPPKGPTLKVFPQRQSRPTRHKRNGYLMFKDHPEFKPNLTPAEVMALGSFGGGYFRPIHSSNTGENYGNEVLEEFPKEWFESLKIKKLITSSTYDKSVNKYGVECGQSLIEWETNGWITHLDPYGWFQWYCRFYEGRRCEDDQRQISRGNGVMGAKVISTGLARVRSPLYFFLSQHLCFSMPKPSDHFNFLSRAAGKTIY